MESRYRLRKSERRVHALLRGENGEAPASDRGGAL